MQESQEPRFPSLGGEDPLEEGMATHFSILPWRIRRDRRGWRATVHGGLKESDTAERLSTHSRNNGGTEMDLLQAHLEKEMVTHSSTLAWKIPWVDEPGRRQSMGSLRVGHD